LGEDDDDDYNDLLLNISELITRLLTTRHEVISTGDLCTPFINSIRKQEFLSIKNPIYYYYYYYYYYQHHWLYSPLLGLGSFFHFLDPI
jgi:hypothetical protein